jgi:hypothetical protein
LVTQEEDEPDSPEEVKSELDNNRGFDQEENLREERQQNESELDNNQEIEQQDSNESSNKAKEKQDRRLDGSRKQIRIQGEESHKGTKC